MADVAAPPHELQSLIDALHTKYVANDSGQVATYIPELGKANPDHFGICLITADGRVFEAGDCDQPFTIQSISKPFAFGLAVEEMGADEVLRRVSVEPSGDAFNSIHLQTGSNRPFNPMINTGAITVSALLHSIHGHRHVRSPARALQLDRRPAARHRRGGLRVGAAHGPPQPGHRASAPQFRRGPRARSRPRSTSTSGSARFSSPPAISP